MKIVRKELSSSEVSPDNIRWDADCNCVQFSPDGGTTWNDSPGLDPRSSASFRLPALSGGDAQCDAAARMAAYTRDQVNAFVTSVGLAQATTAALELLLAVIPGVGWMVDAIIAALELLVTVGIDVIAAAFTDAVYDDLRCTFYCHIGSDGQMSDGQLLDFQADVEAHYSSTVYATMLAIGSFSGAVAYSNAGVERSETGDCSTCNCCNCIDYTIPSAATWALVPCAGSNFVHFDGSGMYTDIPSPFTEAAYINLSAIVAAGASGWCFSFTMTGLDRVIDAYSATAIGDDSHCPSGEVEMSHFPNQQVTVAADHPFVVLAWADHAIHITGFCVEAT